MKENPIRPGAYPDAGGVHFALYSRHATAVELCLFDAPQGEKESGRMSLSKAPDDSWHVYVPGLKAGALYGYRVHGAYAPTRGHRFNANKVVLDPYALAITGTENWDDTWYGYQRGHYDLSFDPRDNAETAPKAMVVDRHFNWEGDTLLKTPRADTLIYELHVRGFTKTFPGLPDALRGTYAGMAHPAVIAYLQRLGITAVELMPVQEFLDERYLRDKGLSNYWGYNTIGFFAPTARYASSDDQVREFKNMVKAMHAAGIEVILDVVYNHSAEGDETGPTLAFRGIDNAEYYRLEGDGRHNYNKAGTGNRLNMRSPAVLRLILDSMCYWVEEMHVDGFRFDLAPALSDSAVMNSEGTFFDLVHRHPVLSTVKLIAEPWDVGDGGYQLGNFKAEWSEWNDQYRDYMRGLWCESAGEPAEFAPRFMGSPDLYADKKRLSVASLNLITSHDGFTLHDLVSYDKAHNEANGTGKTDSLAQSRSWNSGVEGPTEDRLIRRLRAQQKRNFLTTLLLSQGIPMLLAGDELGRTQGGNDNAFCQDNPISWLDWAAADKELIEFTAGLVRLRKDNAVFRSDRWLSATMGVSWLDTGGRRIEDWGKYKLKAFAVVLGADADFYIAFNAEGGKTSFMLPEGRWEISVTTAAEGPELKDGLGIELPGRCIAVLRAGR